MSVIGSIGNIVKYSLLFLQSPQLHLGPGREGSATERGLAFLPLAPASFLSPAVLAEGRSHFMGVPVFITTRWSRTTVQPFVVARVGVCGNRCLLRSRCSLVSSRAIAFLNGLVQREKRMVATLPRHD